jgi:hypothetical protein
LILSIGFSANGNIQSYRFDQLDDFFEEDLFGIKLDYNSDSPGSNALQLISNVITDENIPNQTDPDPTMDNIIALIGHEAQDIHSAFFAVEKVKRTENILFEDPVEWQASLPFVKHLILYELPSGENVVMSQDFLGIALRLEGQSFDYNHYQVGYANIPIEFLDFLINTSASPMSIAVSNSDDSLTIKTTYFNTTYLFQTQDIDFEQVANSRFSDHFLIAQFDKVEITISLLKHSNTMASGVETHLDTRIGNVINLVINEERPDEETWLFSTEKHINIDFNGIFKINDTFSWYKGEEITKRLSLFNKSSLSVLISQNIGIINGTQKNDNFEIMISGQNISKDELSQSDYQVDQNITVFHNENIISRTIIEGYDYVLDEDPYIKTLSINPVFVNLIPLNQHPSLSRNFLFLRETALINELVAESIKRYISNDSLTLLTTDQLLRITRQYMTAAAYVHDLQIEDWKGYPSTVKLLHTALREFNDALLNYHEITSYPILSSVGIFVVLTKYFSGKSRKQSKILGKN